MGCSRYGGTGLRLLRAPLFGDAAVADVFSRVKAERVVVDGADLPEDDGEVYRRGEAVEDAVPDHLGVDGDHVRALRARPADRVRDEHEGEVPRGEVVAPAHDAAVGELRLGRVPEEHVPAKTE